MSVPGNIYEHEMRFVRERQGLKSRYQHPSGFINKPETGERLARLSCEVEVSRDHGVMTFPVRLPRYLMPEWSQEEWSAFIESEIRLLHDFTDEAMVQCLSLALCSQSERRKEILRTANGIVIDFRGDLPNMYLPMMLGGYKVGIYRSGNNWPIWLSIQPTYDLALEEAESIRAEAGLPKSSITAAGALSNFLNCKTNLQPILSNAGGGFDLRIALGFGMALGFVAAAATAFAFWYFR
ncbi:MULTISPECIES: hypothetical protein [Xanthobacter]|uniref:hypothetical protein n=1 Tax=Xanthobacter TaxID=279 RepID=UPI0037286931